MAAWKTQTKHSHNKTDAINGYCIEYRNVLCCFLRQISARQRGFLERVTLGLFVLKTSFVLCFLHVVTCYLKYFVAACVYLYNECCVHHNISRDLL